MDALADLLPRLLLHVRPAFVASALKKLLRIKREVIETPRGRFYVDPVSHLGNSLKTCGEYEPDMTHTLEKLLTPGNVFVDIGANEGYFTVLAAKIVGERGRVLSVEPQTRLQTVLRRNFAVNNVEPVVELHQLALSDRSGTAEIFLAPDVNSGSSGLSNVTRYSNPTERVPQSTLEEFLRKANVSHVDLLKMDIEGFEYEAILGSKQIFANQVIRHLALELHPTLLAHRGKSAEDILAFLKECGYRQTPAYENLVLSVESTPSALEQSSRLPSTVH